MLSPNAATAFSSGLSKSARRNPSGARSPSVAQEGIPSDSSMFLACDRNAASLGGDAKTSVRRGSATDTTLTKAEIIPISARTSPSRSGGYGHGLKSAMGRKRTLLVDENIAVLQRAPCGSGWQMRRAPPVNRQWARTKRQSLAVSANFVNIRVASRAPARVALPTLTTSGLARRHRVRSRAIQHLATERLHGYAGNDVNGEGEPN